MGSSSLMDQDFLQKVTNSIDNHIKDEEFGVKELCREIGVSRSKLHRKLNLLTGKSTSQFIREFRLSRAMEMLRDTSDTAAEIAYKVGFKSPSYFSSSFHKLYGYPPGEAKERAGDPSDEIKVSTSHLSLIQSFRRHWVLLVSLLCTLVVIVALSISYTYSSPDQFSGQGDDVGEEFSEKAIAILPIEMLNEEKQDDYFTERLVTSIQSGLRKIDSLVVISHLSTEPFKDSTVAPSSIARALNVDYLLRVQITNHIDTISAIVNMLDAENVLLESWLIEEVDVLKFQGRIASEIAKSLNFAESHGFPTENPKAYDLYLKGEIDLQKYSNESLNRAIEYYNLAIDLDPDFALAYAGIAECYRILGLSNTNDLVNEIARIKTLAIKSIEINDNSRAHITLGAMALTKECNWEVAETEYKRAIELDPNNPVVHIYYADYLLHVRKELGEAERQLKQAQILDPYNIFYKLFFSKYYFFKRDYDMALLEFGQVSELKRELTRVNDMGFFILVKQEKYAEAVEELESLMRFSQKYRGKVDEIGPIYQASGIEGVFKYLISQEIYFETLISNKHLSLAAYYSFLGENTKSIELLKFLIDSKSHCAYVIPTNPYFDRLHSEPQFVQLMQRIGLDHILETDIKS